MFHRRIVLPFFAVAFVVATHAGELRTWTSKKDDRVEAEFVRKIGSTVLLKDKNGKDLEIKTWDLCKADVVHVECLLDTSGKRSDRRRWNRTLIPPKSEAERLWRGARQKLPESYQRAYDAEQAVAKGCVALMGEAAQYSVSLPFGRRLPDKESAMRKEYIWGELPEAKMREYEQHIQDALAQLQQDLRQAIVEWRIANPEQARMLDLTAATLRAEAQAKRAEAQAKRAEEIARRAEAAAESAAMDALNARNAAWSAREWGRSGGL